MRLLAEQQQQVVSKRNQEEEFFHAFNVVDNDNEVIIDEIHIIELWNTNLPIYKIYFILKDYLKDNYSIDSYILIALIKEQKLPLTEMLRAIPFIHSGFLTRLLENASTK